MWIRMTARPRNESQPHHRGTTRIQDAFRYVENDSYGGIASAMSEGAEKRSGFSHCNHDGQSRKPNRVFPGMHAGMLC